MASDLASITSSEYQKLGFRNRILALKNRAPLAAGERTDPAFENSFGDQLRDLGGRRRWVLVGLALQKWHHDLRDRVDEVLRENQGEIYKGRGIRSPGTVRHCWMLGSDKSCAQPTVVISCSQVNILKATLRVVSQHGVLKAAKFALKAVPVCDLTLRTDRRVSFLSGEDYLIDDNGDIRRDERGHPLFVRRLGSQDPHESHTGYQARLTGEEKPAEIEAYEEEPPNQGTGLENDMTGLTVLDESVQIQRDKDTSEEDYVPLRFGAEEIFVPDSGKPTTLGGFIMVDDVCFGLTTAHAFNEEDEGSGMRSISGSIADLPLYDSDWAEAEEDSGDDVAEGDGSDLHGQSHQERRLQRRQKSRAFEAQNYYTTAWNSLQIVAKSRLANSKGLDWALCELGDWGKYAINGVHLRPELQSQGMPENLLFRNIKSTAPLGKILVATRRGAIPGIGTGSDCSIQLARDDQYRHVWSVELEESLSSGDSGSWVVDATTGDVYGMIIAGSTGLRQEYVIPAADVGQDICRVLRADSVRLPSFQDVMTAHTEERSARPKLSLKNDSSEWESDDSDETLDEEALDKDEERFLLAEALKHSSVDTEILVKAIKNAGVRPKWTKMTLPKGRSLKTSQRAMDRLLSSRRLVETDAHGDKEVTRIEEAESHQSRNESVYELRGPELSRENTGSVDESSALPVGDPPELLDSNPNFRAGISRRAWRAKRQAERGPKHHRRKSSRKSGDIPEADLTLQAPDPFEPKSSKYESKFEMDSEDDPGNDEPDIIVVRHKGSLYKLKFPAFSIVEGQTLVGHLRQQAATEFDVEDVSRVTLVYRGKTLKTDSRTCLEEGLKMRSEVLCVVKRTPIEEIEFLTNKFRTELVPQGIDYITNTPDDSKMRDLDYRRISETILMQILLKLDAVETEGDSEARIRRKELVKEVQDFLNDLDIAANRDVPSNWHADFIEPKESSGKRRTSTPLSGRPLTSRSRSSNLNRSDSRYDASPETSADER